MKRLLPLALVAVAAGAQAQLVVGTNASEGSSSPFLSGAFYIDVEAGTGRQLWKGTTTRSRPTGMVSIGTTLYGGSGLRGFTWNHGAIGQLPVESDRLFRLGRDNIAYSTAFENMTMANGQIYGYTNFNLLGATQVEDGIFRIDPTNPLLNVPEAEDTTLIWRHDDLKYNFKGFAYNEVNGLFYATHNPGDATLTRETGLFTIDAFGTGAVTKIADFGTFVPDATGLTFGGGKLWMSGKSAASTELRIASFDLTTGTYGDFMSIDGFATTTSPLSTALVWSPGAVPEPATLAALSLGALALLRRKRRGQ